MSHISSGIGNVRAFELPGGICADGSDVPARRIALVKWWSCWSAKFYQVYVNGQYAGVTIDSNQRQMVVQVPTYFESAVRIEVFAVNGNEANKDFTGQIDSSRTHSGRVKIAFLRTQDLPIGSTAQIYFDSGSGEIDYNHPLLDQAIRVWPTWQDKAGFGMSRFGFSDFGYDGAGAVGFGKGGLGYGQFGFDADTFEWVSSALEAGIYKFGVKIFDKAGNESNASETGQITVIPAARPAEQISVSSFDKETNQLVLSIS